VARRYAEAIDAINRISPLDAGHYALLAAAQAGNGDAGAAASHVAQVLKLAPDFTVTAHFATLHYRDVADQEHHREMLLRAGLPA
jgi:adenylate cyclase